jgi:hypothetical protein
MQSFAGEFDQISLTGTPGIGKSIFYIYFFQRYRREFPKATIVTASFTMTSKLKQCLRFGPNDILGEKFSDIRELEADIFLYDGPPQMDPGPRKKMVSFTSPNYAWFRVMRKTRYHARMHLPFWSLAELLEANVLLQIGLDDETIQQRYSVFGGVARYCLAPSDEFVEVAIDVLDANLSELKTCDQLRELLRETQQKTEVSHRLFHMTPTIRDKPPFARFFTYSFASRHVAQLISDTIKKNDHALRRNLLDFLKISPGANNLIGELFQGDVEKI